jgi:hypothetical protein
VHGVSATSVLGLLLWIFGYMIDFSSNKKPEEKKPDETPKPSGMFLIIFYKPIIVLS